jgi:hypothetical protein
MTPSFRANMYDFPGFVRPLVYGSPYGSSNFSIGGADVLPGRVPLDVMAGLLSPGYIQSRLAWAAIAVAVVIVAGIIYRPHRATQPRWYAKLTDRLLAAKPPPPANPLAAAAHPSRWPLLGLVVAEFRLIGSNRLMLAAAALAAMAGVALGDRHLASALAALWLIFAFTAHAGQTEPKGLRALTATTVLPPALRRAAFVVAGLGWALALALPGALWHADGVRLVLALATGGVAAIVAMALSAVSGSGFAARIVLLVLWYGYLSS